jgi:hypothetical protein
MRTLGVCDGNETNCSGRTAGPPASHPYDGTAEAAAGARMDHMGASGGYSVGACLRIGAAWWAIGGAPSSVGGDLIAFTGWRAIGLCAAAAGVALALRTAPRRWPLLVAAWGVSAALLAASALLLLDVIGGLLPGLGVAFHPIAFISRAASLGGAVLIGAAAVAYRRRWRSSCLFCGRTGTPARPAQPPRWARWAAYAAVAGCLIRLLAQLAVGFGSSLLQ